MELIDTHCHLNDEAFCDDVAATIERARSRGITQMVVVGVDKKTGIRAIELAENYDNISVALAWHPVDVIDCSVADKLWLQAAWSHPKVVAVGETGLDYHWDKSPKALQADYFRWHVQAAIAHDLPFIIHDRDAHDDTLAILREFYQAHGPLKGVMHSYSAGRERLADFLALGLHISVSGVVTFKNAPEVKKMIPDIPLNRLLVETDAPYLSPVPMRGKRNEPANVYYTAKTIADLRNEPFASMAKITSANAKELFPFSN